MNADLDPDPDPDTTWIWPNNVNKIKKESPGPSNLICKVVTRRYFVRQNIAILLFLTLPFSLRIGLAWAFLGRGAQFWLYLLRSLCRNFVPPPKLILCVSFSSFGLHSHTIQHQKQCISKQTFNNRVLCCKLIFYNYFNLHFSYKKLSIG